MAKFRPSMKHVAERAGVSLRTVSNVVNNYQHVSPYTREIVQKAIAELGYHPNAAARHLRQGKTGMIALAVPNLSWPYFGEIAHLVQREAHGAGYHLLVAETEGSRDFEYSILRDLRTNVIDGLIFSPIEMTADQLTNIDLDAPLVLLGERIRDSEHPHFAVDNEGAAREMTRHLIDQGARSFAILGSTTTQATSSAGVLRLQGFQKELRAQGLAESKVESLAVSPWTHVGAHEAMARRIAQGPLPDAVMALNDILAMGAARACADAGIAIPGRVLLSGWDDSPESRYSAPSITTVSPDKAAIARKAVASLLALINDADAPQGSQIAGHELLIRESTTRNPFPR